MSKKRELGDCVICGSQKATTRDHIPPQGLFRKPRPSNLVTVPSCYLCNNKSSNVDERFRTYLGLHVANSGDEGQGFFKEETLRTLKHNTRLRREIISKHEPAYLITNNGIIYDKAYVVKWDSEAHDAIVGKMIKGLYFHHFGEILGDRVDIRIQWLRKLPPAIIDNAKYLQFNSIGQGEVVYRFGRGSESPLNSIWIFQFYNAHWASGYTMTKATESNRS